MRIHDNIDQNSEEWQSLRAGNPTASEFSKIFTGGGKVSKSRDAYMRQCAVARKYVIPNSFNGNQWTDRGHELEPQAREIFKEQTGFDVREVGFIQHDDCCAGMSPDSLIYSNNMPAAGQEIKCFNYDKHLGIIDKGVMPTDIKPQVHGSLWVSSLNVWAFTIYNPDAEPFTFDTFEIVPDSYTEDLGGHVMEFCEELESRQYEFIEDYEKRRGGICTAARLPALYAAVNNNKF